VGTAAGPQNEFPSPAQLRSPFEFVARPIRLLHAPMTDFANTCTGDGIGWDFAKTSPTRRLTGSKSLSAFLSLNQGREERPRPGAHQDRAGLAAPGPTACATRRRHALRALCLPMRPPRPGPRGQVAGRLFHGAGRRGAVGDVSNVLFAGGWVARAKRRRVHLLRLLRHADARRTTTVEKLLDYVMNTPEDGRRTKVCVDQRCRLINRTSDKSP